MTWRQDLAVGFFLYFLGIVHFAAEFGIHVPSGINFFLCAFLFARSAKEKESSAGKDES